MVKSRQCFWSLGWKAVDKFCGLLTMSFLSGCAKLPTKSQSLYVTRCGSVWPWGRHQGRRQSQQSLAGAAIGGLLGAVGVAWPEKSTGGRPLISPNSKDTTSRNSRGIVSRNNKDIISTTPAVDHGDLSSLLGQIATERIDRELKAKNNNHAFCLPQFVGDW